MGKALAVGFKTFCGSVCLIAVGTSGEPRPPVRRATSRVHSLGNSCYQKPPRVPVEVCATASAPGSQKSFRDKHVETPRSPTHEAHIPKGTKHCLSLKAQTLSDYGLPGRVECVGIGVLSLFCRAVPPRAFGT